MSGSEAPWTGLGRHTRRDVLRRAAAGAVALGALGAARAPRAAAAPRDYTTRETFDHFDHEFHTSGRLGQPTDYNENGGALAWGQSYVLQSFARMYEAYKDPYYLDRLIANADRILATRDSARNVTDYRGESLPAWRAAHPYTAGVVALPDALGRPTLEVRSVLAYADTTTATVSAGTMPGTFKLVVRNGRFNRADTFDNLTMDPASPNFAVKRLYDAFPTSVAVTARDLRLAPGAAGDPAPGTYNLVSRPVIFAVHTGMITLGMVNFVRLVYETPTLRANPRYKAKADEYLTAVEEAIAVHDWEWREDGRGFGYYVWPKGQPAQFDGSELPANQFLAPARTLSQLAVITGNPSYRDRTAKMARTFKNDLRVDAGGAYIWSYWPTWGRIYQGYMKTGNPESDVSLYRPTYCCARQIEDISHGHIDVDFAALAFRNHLDAQLFNGEDMARLARTFTQNVLTTRANGSPTVWSNVNGAGVKESLVWEVLSAGWMALAWWDERIFTDVRTMFANGQPEFLSGFFLYEIANLNWYARRGE